jgi:chromate transporter
MLAVSSNYEKFRGMVLFKKTLDGVLPAVVGLVAAAAWNLGTTSLGEPRDLLLMVAGFAILNFSRTSPMLVILGAGGIGFIFRFS